nr:retrovirus-related Pol polyprotein from transposon TNT 1-94 [Tanacetum cinerariifolium]
MKGEIEDFKNINKSLESSNNFFKEANNKLSETNNLLYADNKKSEAELARHNSKDLNAKTLNVKSIFAMFDKCVLIDKHDMCILNYVAKPIKRTVAFESNKKPRNFTRKLYERVSKTCSWWYSKFTPSGYKWKPKSRKENVNPNVIEVVLFNVNSRCSKHMMGNLKLLINFVEKFLGTVKFGNDQIVPILGYGDLVQGARNDLLTGSRGMGLYSITLQNTNSPNPICLMAKASSSQAWLWHRRLSYLNFDTINLMSKNDIVVSLPKLKFVKDHLCSSCELGKAKRKSFHTKLTPSLKRRLQLLHMDLCGPMRVASINGKRYVLVIIDDYSRYTWTHFLRSKDETSKVLIDFLRLVQRGLQAKVRVVGTDKGMEFLNQTLHAYFAAEGIHHQTSVARTPEQNGVVERRNRTLVEATQTILSTAKTMVLNHDSLSLAIQRQANVPQADRTVITSKELDLLFSQMFDELLNESFKVVSKSSAVSAADALNQRHHHTTPLNNHTTPAPTCQVPNLAPTVIFSENINQAEKYAENDQVADDEFINIFSTPVQDQGETSSRHVNSSNMHTFYQRYPSEHHWTKDRPLDQVIGNPSQSIRTRRQLELDTEMCMFALTVSRTEPKNIKEAMADSAWIE